MHHRGVMKKNRTFRAALAGAAAGHAALAGAAGGHFAVDDARVGPAGQCGNETWFTRDGGAAHLLHLGFKCGASASLELGAAGEFSGGGGGGAAQSAASLQVKWAHPLGEHFSIGAEVQPGWQRIAPAGYTGTGVVALATWAPGKALAWHANFGRDFVRGTASQARNGAAVEWAPSHRWLLVGERFVQQQTQFVRAGARWQGGAHWSLDVSRARSLAGPLPSSWTLGINVDFGR